MAGALKAEDVTRALEATRGVLFATEPAIVWRPVRENSLGLPLIASTFFSCFLFPPYLSVSASSTYSPVVWPPPPLPTYQSYVGRNIVAQNSEFSSANVDDRGYVAVEWWIMSKTQAENAAMKEGNAINTTHPACHLPTAAPFRQRMLTSFTFHFHDLS